ncbi:MAG: DUF4956 domain-containing protein [Fimbriiglobus sp.]
MPDWLRIAVDSGDSLSYETMIIRMALALFAGVVVALIYRATVGRDRKELRSLPTTLALLALLIAIVTLVIGNNVARAFGLAGVLSIVRFRTVVDDTADTAFVIFAVVLGMAMGAGYAMLALISIPVVCLALYVMSFFDTSRLVTPNHNLIVRFALGLDPNQVLSGVLNQYCHHHHLSTLETISKGTNLEARYSLRLKDSSTLVALLSDLAKLEGVQGVELKQAS